MDLSSFSLPVQQGLSFAPPSEHVRTARWNQWHPVLEMEVNRMRSCRLAGTRYIPRVNVRSFADEMKQRAPMLFARWLEEDRFLLTRDATEGLFNPSEMADIALAVPGIFE